METFFASLARTKRGIHWQRVNSPHKGQWRGALMFSFICAWIYSWVNNSEDVDLRRHLCLWMISFIHTKKYIMRLRDAYIRRWIGCRIMVCCLFLYLNQCYLFIRATAAEKFQKHSKNNSNIFSHEKGICKCRLQSVNHFVLASKGKIFGLIDVGNRNPMGLWLAFFLAKPASIWGIYK